MRILIPGGSGYIGTALMPLLADCDITVMDKVAPTQKGVKYIETDFMDNKWLGNILELVKKTDIVIYLAAYFGSDDNISKKINYEAPSLLYSLCVENNIDRFIFTSTCGVHNPDDKSAYTLWKSKTEEHLQTYYTYHAPWIILRLASVFGNSNRMSYEPLINGFVRDAKEGSLKIFGANEQRPFVHIDTAVRTTWKLAFAPISYVAFHKFDLATENMTKQKIADIIKRKLPNVKMEMSNSNKAGYIVDTKRTLTALNIISCKTVEEGIEEMINA